MVTTNNIAISTNRVSFSSFSGMSRIPAVVIVVFIAVVASSISMSDAYRRPSAYRLVSTSLSSSRGRPRSVSTSAASSGGCEPVRLPLCRSTMPYSRTRLPNLLDHATQHNARLVFDQYQMLIKTGCGVTPVGDGDGNGNGASVRSSSVSAGEDALAFYLCAVFAPICPTGFEQAVSSSDSSTDNGAERSRRPERQYQHPSSGRRRTRYGSSGGALSGTYGIGGQLIPPCRGVCERARAGCEPVMRRYNVSWPDELDCSRWPTQDRGVCISPESIDWRRRTREDRVPDCRCFTNETHLSTRDAYMQSDFDYVIHATYKRSKRFRNVNDSATSPDDRPSSTKKSILVFRMYVRQILKSKPSVIATLLAENTTVTVVWTSTVATGRGSDCDALCSGSGPRHSSSVGAGMGSLRRGEDYLLMGQVDQRRRRLQLDEKSVIEPWKKNWPVYIRKWERRSAIDNSPEYWNRTITFW